MEYLLSLKLSSKLLYASDLGQKQSVETVVRPILGVKRLRCHVIGVGELDLKNSFIGISKDLTNRVEKRSWGFHCFHATPLVIWSSIA